MRTYRLAEVVGWAVAAVCGGYVVLLAVGTQRMLDSLEPSYMECGLRPHGIAALLFALPRGTLLSCSVLVLLALLCKEALVRRKGISLALSVGVAAMAALCAVVATHAVVRGIF